MSLPAEKAPSKEVEYYWADAGFLRFNLLPSIVTV